MALRRTACVSARPVYDPAMARTELSPTELLERLNQLVTALGTTASATELPAVVLRQLATTFGATAARLTLVDESLGPAAASVIAVHGDAAAVMRSAWVSLELSVGARAIG